MAFQRLADSIEARLSRIEVQRAQETRRILEDLIAKTRVLTESERQRRELKTRWDILGELDKLADETKQDSAAERESMRAVLVANEANLQNDRLDFLGSIYLDCLIPIYFGETKRLRSELLLEMRRILRPSAISNILLDRPWRGIGIATGVVAAVLAVFLLTAPYFAFGTRLTARWAILTAAVIEAYLALAIGFGSAMWRSRWNRRFAWATREARGTEGVTKQ